MDQKTHQVGNCLPFALDLHRRILSGPDRLVCFSGELSNVNLFQSFLLPVRRHPQLFLCPAATTAFLSTATAPQSQRNLVRDGPDSTSIDSRAVRLPYLVPTGTITLRYWPPKPTCSLALTGSSSARRHPQLFVLPIRMNAFLLVTTAPQSHLRSTHSSPLILLGSAMATSRPNLSPG